MTCPHCGSHTFDVGGPITIWQTQTIRVDGEGERYVVEEKDLHDTVETHPWEDAHCADCGQSIPADDLYRSLTHDEGGMK